jgi:hypothetical protein
MICIANKKTHARYRTWVNFATILSPIPRGSRVCLESEPQFKLRFSDFPSQKSNVNVFEPYKRFLCQAIDLPPVTTVG